MSKAKFCWQCGTKMTEKTYDIFDEQTGKRKKGNVCRKCNPCDHEFKTLPFWHLSDYECVKCGKKQDFSW